MMMMMSSLKLALIFGAALGLYQFNAQNTNYLASVVPQYNTNNTDQLTTSTSALLRKPGFDYFLLVLQWPEAFCKFQQSKGRKLCNPIRVRPEHQKKFTVHGLWPQLNGAQSPLCCTTTQSMQDSDLNKFKKELLQYWPDLFSAEDFQTSKCFWKYEWDRHGTCSSNKFNPHEYLEKTLFLAKQYATRIFDKVIENGINPEGTTEGQLSQLRQSVRMLTGSYPILNKESNRYGEPVLLEIKLCVKKDGATLLMKCPKRYKFAAPINKEPLSPVLDAAAER